MHYHRYFTYILIISLLSCSTFFFFNDTATTEIYTFPYTTLFRSQQITGWGVDHNPIGNGSREFLLAIQPAAIDFANRSDRKSTRLNSSHLVISYAVFCLKKKKNNNIYTYSHLYYCY